MGDIIILKENMEIKAPPAEMAVPPAAPTLAAQTPSAEKGVLRSITGAFRRGGEKQACPTCGKPLTYIEQYKRWYCYNCGKYV